MSVPTANPFLRTPDNQHVLFDVDGQQLKLPAPPPWRNFPSRCREVDVPDEQPFPTTDHQAKELASVASRHCFRDNQIEAEIVKAALILRRPILITGSPGVGKSSLAYVAAHYLKLGPVLRWNINSRTTLRDGFYQYDAIGRLQDYNWEKELAAFENRSVRDPKRTIGRYFRLGPLGTALLPRKFPRVLLIDEIDKSDLDLPNDLLHALEEGRFEIPELRRMEDLSAVDLDTADDGKRPATIHDGEVRCWEFPLIFMTSNGERDFSSAFLRRCLHLDMPQPNAAELGKIVRQQLSGWAAEQEKDLESKSQSIAALAQKMADRLQRGEIVATDQLLGTFFVEGFYGFDSKIESATQPDVSKSPQAKKAGA